MVEPGGPAAVVERARRTGIKPGEQRAYVVARMLEDVRVIVAGIEDPDEARAVGFVPAVGVDEALRQAGEVVGAPAKVLVVPHALLTLPIVAEPAGVSA